MNGVTALDDAIATKAQQKAEDLQRATEAGWQKPIPFEYGGIGEPDAETGMRDDVKWLSDAVVYEWVDEYGEVGPENLALEKELFGDSESEDHRQSANFRIYESFEVNLDGGSGKIQPFRNVSRPGTFTVTLAYTQHSSKMLDCIRSFLTTSNAAITMLRHPFRPTVSQLC